MLLKNLAEASARVAATRSRTRKVAALADALRKAGPEDVEIAASYLGGDLRQRRTGLGWRSVQRRPEPAAAPTLTLVETDAAFEALSRLSGPGSASERAAALTALLARATAIEQSYLVSLIAGEVRQGALDGLLLEAVAAAADVPAPAVRRAAMMAGSTTAIVAAALTGGADALAVYDLRVGRAVRPMLASSSPTVAEALLKADPGGGEVAVEAKLDGIRIQAHKDGDEVRLFTRSLEDLTARMPEIVAAVQAVAADSAILDGEAIALGADGRPRPFQETSSRTASAAGDTPLSAQFFDVLALDGRPLTDRPLLERMTMLAEVAPVRLMIQRTITAAPAVAEAFLAHVISQGHEGVVVKNLQASYDAGRRGAAWVKVKPVHTLDLVVLAVEEGSGRRAGWLSNIHLGARGPDGGFVRLGKTFKGMTDEMLAWQTERFAALETHREGHVVHLRPEQVVEVAFDGLQRSSRYPGGLALRFARVVRYRDDKTADDADTIETVRALAR